MGLALTAGADPVAPLGPYSRTMPRVLGGSQLVGRFLMSEMPMYSPLQGDISRFLSGVHVRSGESRVYSRQVGCCFTVAMCLNVSRGGRWTILWEWRWRLAQTLLLSTPSSTALCASLLGRVHRDVPVYMN